MEKPSISFVLVVLILGFFLGTVIGSLLAQVFGFEFLNLSVTGGAVRVAENFYVFDRLDLMITPAGIIGLLVAIFFLYKKEKG